jgi:hypothetical protein
VLIADVSEHCIRSIFKGRSMKYEVINMVGHIALILFGMLDFLNEEN